MEGSYQCLLRGPGVIPCLSSFTRQKTLNAAVCLQFILRDTQRGCLSVLPPPPIYTAKKSSWYPRGKQQGSRGEHPCLEDRPPNPSVYVI